MKTKLSHNPYIDLLKYRISIAVALSSAVGWLLNNGGFTFELILVLSGVFFLASAASSLNMIQEMHLDAKMERTNKRPLPAGLITKKRAIIYTIFLIVLGASLLAVVGIIPTMLGLLNILFYNGIYTPLKTKTLYSVLPGSLVGAVPPIIGWTATGGAMHEIAIVILAIFMFIWQVPHFWLLAIKYKRQYENAGYATITKVFSDYQIKQLIFSWIIFTSAIVMAFPIFGVVKSFPMTILLMAINCALIYTFYKLAFDYTLKIQVTQAFLRINLFLIAIYAVLIGDVLLA